MPHSDIAPQPVGEGFGLALVKSASTPALIWTLLGSSLKAKRESACFAAINWIWSEQSGV